jgi:putative effector of murein hydrolase LrgA (UPF0299 family)
MSKRADKRQKRWRASKAAPGAAGTLEAAEPINPPAPLFRLERLKEPAAIFTILYVAGLMATSYRYLSVTLARTWFYSSDEYVAVAEVIRFSTGSFRQHFIDWPATPMFLIAGAVWGIFTRSATLLTNPTVHGALDYTYQHIAWVFGVTRFMTVFFHGVSLVLVFLVAQKALNKAGACVSALLVLMNETYAGYSTLTRPESMALCVILSSVLVAYYALEHSSVSFEKPPHWRDPLTIAAVLAGIGVGVRINSFIASLPLLWMLLVFRRRTIRKSYPKWIRRMALFAVPAMVAVGTSGFLFSRSKIPYVMPHAYAMLEKAFLTMACVPVLMAFLYRSSKTRRLLLRLAPAEVVKLAVGFAIGGVIGFPTLFSQARYMVASMEMYSGSFIDWYRTKWPLAQNLRFYTNFYMNVAAPDRIILYLLIAGTVMILLLRDRRALPYIIAAATFFVSRPLNLQLAAHHMIFWIPFYTIVCAYPVALAYALWEGRIPRWALNAAFAVVLAAIATHLTNGLDNAAAGARNAEGRLASVAKATTWMKSHLGGGESIATAYACFNGDVFYKWTQELEVPVPRDVFDPNRSVIWWGRRREIAGRAGFACITEGDIDPIRRGMGPQETDQATDPYHDAAFQQVATFGKGNDKVDVFHFDFRGLR